MKLTYTEMGWILLVLILSVGFYYKDHVEVQSIVDKQADKKEGCHYSQLKVYDEDLSKLDGYWCPNDGGYFVPQY